MIEVKELLAPDGVSQGWFVLWGHQDARLFSTKAEAEAFAAKLGGAA